MVSRTWWRDKTVRAAPLIADATQAGPEATRQNLHSFVRQAIHDGLVDGLVDGAATDGTWLCETVALTGQSETFLLLRRTTHWTTDEYRTWLNTTLRRLFRGR